MQGATTKAYRLSDTSRRSDAADGPPAAATNCLTMSWANGLRIAASLVVAVFLYINTSSSSFLALLASWPSAVAGIYETGS